MNAEWGYDETYHGSYLTIFFIFFLDSNMCINCEWSDLVLRVQFKKREKHPWRSVNLSKVSQRTTIVSGVNNPLHVTGLFLSLTSCFLMFSGMYIKKQEHEIC